MEESSAKHGLLRFASALRHEHNQARMQIDRCDEINEVLAIVGHENKTALTDFREDRVIGRASQAEMGDMIRFKAKLMRDCRKLGAEALVDQERVVHTRALVCHGRFLGRPGRG